VTFEQVIAEITRYETELAAILLRFTRGRGSIHIGSGDDPIFRQYVREIIDLFDDALGQNSYSEQIASEFNHGISNFFWSPSYKSVENILSVIRAARTRFTRSPELLVRKKAENEFNAAKREYEQTGTAFLPGSVKWEQVLAKYNAARDSYDFALRSASLMAKTGEPTTPKKEKLERFRSAFGEYAVGSIVGEGGTGRVFESAGEDGRKLAVKCLLPANLTSVRSKRFKDEIGFCMRNTHPNLITALDWGLVEVEGQEVPFYVMPLYSSTLRKLMQSGIEHVKILSLFTQVLDGIEAAHRDAVWHRDLKPENILYESDADRLVIADFGIAHFSEPLLRTLIETGSEERLANFKYAAPEQRTKKEVNDRADVYALGLILNEMFTGELIQGTRPKLIGSVARGYSYLDDIVDRMVRQSPDERPSISQVRAALVNAAPGTIVDPETVILVSPAVPVPQSASDTAAKMEKLRKNGARIKIHPIIPEKCAEDEFRIGDVGSGSVQFEKLGSGHRVTVPIGRISEALTMDASEKSATVVLAGRLQWISMSQSWKFFLEVPPLVTGLQIGFGKPSSAMDQRRIDVESMLKS
jgi:hypothetical protein